MVVRNIMHLMGGIQKRAIQIRSIGDLQPPNK